MRTTRRTKSTRHILATIAALMLATASAAAATDVEPVASDPWSEHPIVGSWSVNTAPGDGTDAQDMALFRPDGTMLESGPAGRGAGTWIPTGEWSVDAVFNVPWAGGATFDGFVTVRTSIVVGIDGDSFAGIFTLEGPAAAGLSADASVAESVVGTRTIEAPEPEPTAID